ncbi:kinase-like domain-containing protein [Mycena olivaceomarginata]|nr:kinase-like domain-containing protein [Mycena olivaceomarginata]
MAAIHSRGRIHGNFHPSNFGFAAPEPNKFSDIDLWDRMRIQDLFPSVSTSRTPSSSEFVQRPLSIRALDLGTAFTVDESHPLQACTPILYAAPEIVFAWEALNNRDMACDQRSDISSLALCIYALVSSTHIFSSKGMYGSFHIWSRSYGTATRCPKRGVAGSKKILSLSGYLHSKNVERTFTRHSVKDPLELIKLLRRMMALDPAKRSTAAEILRDPYFDGMQTD